MKQIQWFTSKFYVAFLCIYDVIRLHQVSGSSNYDDAMTKQVPGVSWANFVGRHKPSVPKENSDYFSQGPSHYSLMYAIVVSNGHNILVLFFDILYYVE